MATQSESLNEISDKPRTIWPLAVSAGGVAAWLLGRNTVVPYATEHGWRGNEGLWDVWSHANNVLDSLFVVGTAFMLIRQGNLLYKTSLAKACMIGGVVAGVGVCANVVVDTPDFTELPPVAAVVENRFPGHTEPNIEDQWWGDATSILEASVLTAAMATRRKEGEDDDAPQVANIAIPGH